MTPDKELENKELSDKGYKYYIFTYRDGIQSLPIFSVIKYLDKFTQRDVVVKCQKYCKQKNIRYVSVRPFILELGEGDKDEAEFGQILMTAS